MLGYVQKYPCTQAQRHHQLHMNRLSFKSNRLMFKTLAINVEADMEYSPNE